MEAAVLYTEGDPLYQEAPLDSPVAPPTLPAEEDDEVRSENTLAIRDLGCELSPKAENRADSNPPNRAGHRVPQRASVRDGRVSERLRRVGLWRR